jgi:hypothetical protein
MSPADVKQKVRSIEALMLRYCLRADSHHFPRNQTMKSLKMAVFLSLVAGLSTACGRGNESEVGASTAADAPATTERAEFAIVEPVDPARSARNPCALDSINGQLANARTINVQAGAQLLFQGWVSDPGKRTPDAFTIMLTGAKTYGVSAKAGLPRPDVARALNTPDLGNSGFAVVTQLGPVEAGKYRLVIVQGGGDKPAAICDAAVSLVVAGAAN